jgi:predicted MarR family transcription regulator
MGTLGIGGTTGSPSAGQADAPSDYGAVPQAVETDAQRKARETQQKINNAADTVNVVKGIFNAFDSGK